MNTNERLQRYNEFLKSKIRLAQPDGFDCEISEVNPALKPHNKLMVKWMVEGGRRACFASFGLHKTVTQLETVRIVLTKTGGRGLIIAPLGVRQEFSNDAVRILGWPSGPKFIRNINEAAETGVYITNYETVRDGKLDPRLFNVASLDEASILRGLGGSKTFREFMRLFTGDAGVHGNRRGTETVPYRFVATATPSPNDYIELLAYADFLGIMDVSQAKTRFFKRDSTKADKLTIYPHKTEEFWLWVASWALFVSVPSDLTGNPADDSGYVLPPMEVRWHEIPTDHNDAGVERNGQYKAFAEAAIGLDGSAKEKRKSLKRRVDKMLSIHQESPESHVILWHDLEDERRHIQKTFPKSKAVFGTQKLELREEIVSEFSDGSLAQIAAKPSMLGSGTNLQKHCNWAIYSGIGFKFNDFIQSIHRIVRFGQKNPTRIDLIYTEAERQIRKQLEHKWQQHDKMVNKMIEIVRKYGLSQASMASLLARKMGVERVEIKGQNFSFVNNDNVLELPRIESNSVGLILTSIPFATQYEYSPNYADYGHSENTVEFFQQMDFSTPEALRVLMPGRICAVHVKDRIVPGGINGLGYQTAYPFHCDVINHFIKHGFGYLGMKTIVTDVVRENSQTYRLGWSEQCKDGSKMGVGMPEYLLLFRKTPTDTSNAYADVPVLKEKRMYDKSSKNWSKGYSRARWQMDAHGFTRSSGDRLLNPEEVAKLEPDAIFKLFKTHSLEDVWDFEQIVSIAETLEAQGKLPPGFMILQPQSWSDEVWTDITRMRTLNGSQWSLGKEMHVCPFQIDIVERVIEQMSNPGDVVLDYFAGIGTVPMIAVEKGRYGKGIELNPTYFLDGSNYCKATELKQSVPTLFDLIEEAV
ncbi:MAG TPA: DNA methyltransferase [Parapedobacter sp.]|uniref:DNA methyltransferase n=1 Tax=Parapedobacter sp. TaxID=1958893 RepID=UPI002BEC2D81|nr:DNA methyltransferase [Parapedobacter sp.]HWK58133.1 DNA methyltransferase [Parapedobacter sp.]